MRLTAWWTLIRGGNALLSGIAAWAGMYLATGRFWLPEGFFAVLPPILITAAGNIDNDLCDITSDFRNKPDRPLVSGAIKPQAALLAVYACCLLGIGLAWPGGVVALAIAITVTLTLFAYNRYLSGRPIAGNVIIAALGALPIAFGATVARAHAAPVELDAPVIASVIAFWLHLPREMLKDALDTDGDRDAGRLTLPLVIGPLKTARWAGIVMFVAACYIAWSAFSGSFGVLYTFGVLITVMPALLLGAAQCGFNPSGHVIERWSFGLKLCMVAGLMWLVMGRVV